MFKSTSMSIIAGTVLLFLAWNASIVKIGARTPSTLTFQPRSFTKTNALVFKKALKRRGPDQLRGGSMDELQEHAESTNTTEPLLTPTEAFSEEHEDGNFKQKCNERANFVKYILYRRMEYVKNGNRMRDFAKWVKNKNIESTIVSLHGVEPSNVHFSDSNPVVPVEEEAKAIALLEKDPFSADRMNLDIVLTSQTPEDCFKNSNDEFAPYKAPSFLQLCWRSMQLGFHFAPVWSTAGLAYISTSFREKYWYKWMAQSIGNSGAAWIKWGQWSSTRNDMFPEALCDQLATLHASAPAHSWEYSQKAVEHSLGLGPGTIGCVFDEFDQECIASGSIAQVHKANLCGMPVAVKIRHPRVQQLIDMDFRLMKAAATLLEKIPAFSWLHIRESVDQFSHTMAAQAYLQVEAHHLEVLNYNFRRWPRIQFPKPFYASSSVIIETFEPGRIATDLIDEYDNMAAAVKDIQSNGVNAEETDDDGRRDVDVDNAVDDSEPNVQGHELMPTELSRFLVSSGVSLYLKMLLIDNLMHADLHPGNIIVDGRHYSKSKRGTKALVVLNEKSQDGKGSAKNLTLQQVWDSMNDAIDNLQITLVDAGMVAQLNDQESNIFIGLLSCLGEGDGEEAAKYALQFSVENSMSDQEQAAFTEEMKELFAQSCRGYGTSVHVGEVLRGVLGLIRKHHVRIDANFATLVINVLCIESLARRVCPNYNVLDAARPLLQGYRRLAQKSRGMVPRHQSRMFKMWMALNIFKKQVGDVLFFMRESKRKLRKQAQIAKSLDLSFPFSSQRLSSTKWAVLAIILTGTTASRILPFVAPESVEVIRNIIPNRGAAKIEAPSDPMEFEDEVS